MDNPQETENLNIKWLAGFFDAEGSIGFNDKPIITIMNVCPNTSFVIKDTMIKIGIIPDTHMREKPSKSSKKLRWNIFLRYDEQILPFLQYVKPYIKGKKFQLELLEEWYKNQSQKIQDKLFFANQVYNQIVCKPQSILQKLKINNLEQYADIPILNDDDRYIITNNFNCLNYCAGLLDADGSFNLDFISVKGKSKYTPQIIMMNKNKEIVKSYCSVLTNNHIGYHVLFNTSEKKVDKRKWKITISGCKRCIKMLESIVSKIHTKREQANLMLQYCRYKLNNSSDVNDVTGFECKKALDGMKKGFYV